MAAYTMWREEVLTYLKVHSLDNRRMTNSDLGSLVIFACALPPIMARIELVRDKHWADNVEEVDCHLRRLVLDTAKNLRWLNACRLVEARKVCKVKGPLSKCSPKSMMRYLVLTHFISGSIQRG
ncbi:hypothetical protein L873DRAFT_1793095 [Choiromyces venosus 120613-1]|uniref:Uncharacterized protein n=1 Tax=Choiromyces venosus 120613-1 TaxID=1336337 RepID=A0A3N4JK37_9PEZI|nr:hypothetical protein L873DRAFT_1793095 [Choiromyces venosus 120613-1]